MTSLIGSKRLTDLLIKYDKPVPRYTSYPTAAAFSSDVGPEHMSRQLAEPSDHPLSLYVHIPFCRYACWYCGCNRIATQLGSKIVGPFLDTLSKELELIKTTMTKSRPLAQIHWGGGTPNYLNDDEITRLWELISSRFEVTSDLEASIEVNPEFLSKESALHLRRVGFNRISFGIQDANPEVQKAVNRVVPVEQLRRVMGWLREADFSSVNVDLICGLPLQTPDRFRRTIELVRELRPDRISLFSFAYLPEKLPLQGKIAADDLPSRRERISMLEQAHRDLLQSDYVAIGMDHYALADDSLAKAALQGDLHRNFQGYTLGGELDLLGVGPTAISQFPHLISQNQRDLKAYTKQIASGTLPVERGIEVRDPELIERQTLIKQLMCKFAITLDRNRFSLEWNELKDLAADGLVELESCGELSQVQVTGEGRWLIRTIAAVFDPQQRRCCSGARLV